MTLIRAMRRGVLPVAVLTLLAAGCGTQQRASDDNNRGQSTASGAPEDFPCPGETPTPTPTASAPAPEPGDHYAENHGFMIPIPLHGQARCDGLAAVSRIEEALEPLRRRGDFDPAHTQDALLHLGYGTAHVLQSGPTGVRFLIEDSGMCLEGSLNRAATEVDVFDGYPDHTGCDRPSGGH